MNKLIVALCASAFALGSVSALAGNDMKPLSKMETEQAKAARATAKAHWEAMTPEQQAAAKKAARNKKLSDASALDMIANDNMQYDAKQGAADAAKSKEMAKPTQAQRAQDLKSIEKTQQEGSGIAPLPPKK
jgi:hypothetical protein